ncbi:MAG: ATP-binding protein, partial [Actinobacteria bacterium]|nr:ATP-binding protein [Actinomycetota bacterium]
MFYRLSSFALAGIEAIEVSVEAHISSGLPSFTVVGLPDKAVNESRQRVRAAIINSGYKFPMKRIIINLSPADIRKEGPLYDLPLAISILAVSGQIKYTGQGHSITQKSGFVGELSLDGNINPVKGVISMAEFCIKSGKKFLFIPSKNEGQVQFINGVVFVRCSSLKDVIEIISENKIPPESVVQKKEISEQGYDPVSYDGMDFSDIKGQIKAKRAIEVAVSGMHNIILIGPPGAGKTMLAQRIVTIMPALSAEESMEVTRIYSLCK